MSFGSVATSLLTAGASALGSYYIGKSLSKSVTSSLNTGSTTSSAPTTTYITYAAPAAKSETVTTKIEKPAIPEVKAPEVEDTTAAPVAESAPKATLEPGQTAAQQRARRRKTSAGTQDLVLSSAASRADDDETAVTAAGGKNSGSIRRPTLLGR